MPPGVALRLWGEPWAGSLAPVSSLMMRLTAASHPQGSWAVLDAFNKRARTFLLGPFTIVEGQRKTLATLPAAPALEPGWLCLRSPVCQASSPDGGRQTGPRDPPPPVHISFWGLEGTRGALEHRPARSWAGGWAALEHSCPPGDYTSVYCSEWTVPGMGPDTLVAG